MQLLKILDSIVEFKPEYLVERIPEGDIHSCQVLGGSSFYVPGTLYIGNTSVLPLLDRGAFPPETPFFCVRNVEVDPELPYAPVLFEPEVALQALADAVVGLLADENRVRTGIQQLVSAYHTNRGVQHIVDEAAAILGNPLLVVDASYKIIAMCQSGFSSRPDIEAQRSLGYMLAENVEDLKHDAVYDRIREKRYPYYSEQQRMGTAWMNALVYMQNIEVAQIGVLEQNRRFEKADFELVSFLCDLVSLELQKNDFFKANKGMMHGFFLSELLDGHVADSEIVKLRMQHLNWSVTENMYVMVLTGAATNFIEGEPKVVASRMQELVPSTRWAVYDRALVFLLVMKEDSTEFFAENSELYEYLALNGLVASISSRFDSLLEVRGHYGQARKAYELGRMLNRESPVYYYPEYLCQHIGQLVAQSHNLMDFMHPAIIALMRYDEEHNANLVETLDCYLRYNDNPALVAKTLHIHRNTLFYRINRVKELCDLNLNDGDERLKIQLSMKFLQIINKG